MADPVNLLFGTPNLDQVKASILGLIPIFDRVARTGKTSADRAGRDQVRAQRTADAEVAKSAAQAAREKERIAKAASKAELNFIRAGQHAIDAAERERTRAAQRGASERERIARAAQRAELNFIRAGQHAIAAAEKERLRASQSVARAAESTLQRRSRGFGGAVGGATSRVMGMAGHVAGVAAALGGGFTIADSLRTGMEEEKTAGVIFRGATNRGEFRAPHDVEKLARGTAIATGGTTADVLGGLDMFVRKTGDLGTARNMLEDMAKLSAATGTNFADMGNTAAEVFNQLNDSAKTLEVMRALAGQGRAGAIDIKDLGQYGGRLAASAAQFSGGLSGNIESFGAIAQLAKKLGGATDTAEATESVARLSSDFAKNEFGFKSIGVDVFSDKSRTKFRNAEDVITESVVKSKGDMTVLKSLFGERSIRAALGAQVAFAGAGGGAAGEAAIRGQFASLKATTMTTEQVDEGVRGRLAENDAKLAIATEQYRAALNDRLLPLMPGLIERFTQMIPQIQRFLDFFISSPWQGIGALVGGAIVLEVGKAGIAAGVSTIFTKLASSVLGLFTNTTPAAVANITAGVANVAGGASIPGAATGGAAALLGKGGGAAVGLAGTAVGTGLIGAAAMIPLGFHFLGEHREKKGAAALQSILSMPAGTTEEKQMKISALEGAIDKGRARETFNKAALRGQENELKDRSGADIQFEAFRKAMGSMASEIESLKSQIHDAGPAITAFADSLPKKDPGSGWPNGGPP